MVTTLSQNFIFNINIIRLRTIVYLSPGARAGGSQHARACVYSRIGLHQNEEDNFLNRILILIDIVKSELNKNVQGRLTTHDSRHRCLVRRRGRVT